MFRRIAMVALLGVFALAVGCSDAPKAEPKAVGTPDPRLKPAGAGGGGAGETPKPAAKGD